MCALQDRHGERAEMVRLVGLSATLPNYRDVASFLRRQDGSIKVSFDNSYFRDGIREKLELTCMRLRTRRSRRESLSWACQRRCLTW
jgi:replicative superfamily II helicase